MLITQENRYNAKQCLDHPWFKKDESKLSKFNLSRPTLENLKRYTKLDKLKKAILLYIAYTSNNSEIEKYKRYFQKLLKTENSFVDYAKFFEALSEFLPAATIKNIFNSLDLDDNGKIYYSEFLAATVTNATYLKEENLKSAFIFIDKVRLDLNIFRTVEGTSNLKISKRFWVATKQITTMKRSTISSNRVSRIRPELHLKTSGCLCQTHE